MTEQPGIHLVHTDPLFVVVEKPAELLSVPGRGPDKQDCVEARVRELFPDCPKQPAVHRLDMATSGLMLLALSKDAHRELSNQFAMRLVTKRYIALLDGIVAADAGSIELAFRLDPDNRPYQIHDPVQGKIGISAWKKIGVEKGKTRIEFTPHTGRTHQLRLHASHEKGLGCPIVGDRLYGSGKEGERLMLHAAFLNFSHPETGEKMSFSSVVPF